MIFATATFAVNSVAVSANIQTIANIAIGCIEFNPVNEFPRISDNLDDLLPADIAKPPPSTSIKLQCIFWCIICHVIIPGDGFLGRLVGSLSKAFKKSSFAGSMKNKIVRHVAAVESLTGLQNKARVIS